MGDDGNTGSLTGALRLIIGLAQGLALYLLYAAADAKSWPATDGMTFAPLLFVALFIPLGLSLSLGSLRPTTLTIWSCAATLAVANVAFYAVWKMAPEWQFAGPDQFVANPQIVPPFGAFFFTAVWLFIAHTLISGSDADKRLVANYPTHFDIGWKLAVQLLLSAAFVGVFWGLLYLGAGLFDLIKLDFLEKLIEHRWFGIPATALAIAASIHLTDVRAGLVRGLRTLALVLLGWFLPLMTLLAAGFLVALLFTGLEPLWQTRHASAYLLVAAAALIVLINAAYQDAGEERELPRVLRYAGSLAAIVLVPLVVLAAYALYLRVDEYGWTADRVATEACIIVAACYALGYAFAAVFPGEWLKRIERWNFISAVLILIVLAAIFSPLADPDRIAVNSQVARLEGGKIAPDKFDFDYLRWHSGAYGVAALQRLASQSAKDIRTKASELLAKKTRYQLPPKAQATDVATNVTVYPKGSVLPQEFLRRDWSKADNASLLPACLQHVGMKCEAFLLDLGGDGMTDIVILKDTQQDTIFAQDGHGAWRAAGRPGPLWNCESVLEGLRAGDVMIARPSAPQWRDVTVKGAQLTILPTYDQTPSCPK